jgi:hypothetical protein
MTSHSLPAGPAHPAASRCKVAIAVLAGVLSILSAGQLAASGATGMERQELAP